MKRIILSMSAICAAVFSIIGQTVDVEALDRYNTAVIRQVYDVARYVHLSKDAQKQLADAFQNDDELFVMMVRGNGGMLSVKDSRRLEKNRDNILSSILDSEQLAQYYRGVFDAVSNEEGIAIADKLQKKYNLTDQNWKFIRIAFYKIALESRVINKILADNPAKAKKQIAQLRTDMLRTIEEKGGIRVNDDMTVTVLRPFNPDALHKE